MFDQLVESKSNAGENTKRGGFLITTFLIVSTVFIGGVLWSLFAKDLGVGGGDLELSSLVTPVPLPEAEPPKPEPEVKQEKQQASTEKQSNIAVLKEQPVQSLDSPPKEPPPVSTAKSGAKVVPNMAYKVDPNAARDSIPSGAGPVREGPSGGPVQVGKPAKVDTPDDEKDPPPTIKTPTPTPKPTPEKTPPPVPKIVSGGVVNGKAVNLVKPPYPPAAKAVRASGAVNVQVTIDENGNVISASASSGHPLLRSAAESAARSSKFSPTMLSGQKVKVTGVIVYNFAAQ